MTCPETVPISSVEKFSSNSGDESGHIFCAKGFRAPLLRRLLLPIIVEISSSADDDDVLVWRINGRIQTSRIAFTDDSRRETPHLANYIGSLHHVNTRLSTFKHRKFHGGGRGRGGVEHEEPLLVRSLAMRLEYSVPTGEATIWATPPSTASSLRSAGFTPITPSASSPTASSKWTSCSNPLSENPSMPLVSQQSNRSSISRLTAAEARFSVGNPLLLLRLRR